MLPPSQTPTSLTTHPSHATPKHALQHTTPSNPCTMVHCPLNSIETKDCRSFHYPPFYYAYGNGSLIASLYRDTLTAVLIFTVLDLNVRKKKILIPEILQRVNKRGDGGVVVDSGIENETVEEMYPLEKLLEKLCIEP
ncbi:aspartic proteinase nepenthesin-2-like protein, partial [Trifolium pratense]